MSIPKTRSIQGLLLGLMLLYHPECSLKLCESWRSDEAAWTPISNHERFFVGWGDLGFISTLYYLQKIKQFLTFDW
jgi:hypothetical protein